MNKMYKMIFDRLENKKSELKKKQTYFMGMCEREIESGTFEQNAISDLLVMQQLKSEIGELEHWEMFLKSQMK